MKELLSAGVAASSRAQADYPVLQRCLRLVRQQLGMEVAFVSRFADGRRQFVEVDCELGTCAPMAAGDSDPLEESYCQRVVDGRLPQLIHNAAALPEAVALKVTHTVPVGAHLSVPIRLADGRLFGTFCCFSRSADESLGERDLRVMEIFAELAAEHLQGEEDARRNQEAAHLHVDAALASNGMHMVFQPICAVRGGEVMGYEALARFPDQAPDRIFAEAASVGRGVELELRAIALALQVLPQLGPGQYLSLNASPATVLDARLTALLQAWPLPRLVLEVTEHAAVEHYDTLAAALQPLQSRGLQLAIDDAGAGYASFRHVLNLAPHQIKLDISLTRDLHRDRTRYALAAALCGFGKATGCLIVAEGVESADELAALRELGIQRAQGYYLGRPAPLP